MGKGFSSKRRFQDDSNNSKARKFGKIFANGSRGNYGIVELINDNGKNKK